MIDKSIIIRDVCQYARACKQPVSIALIASYVHTLFAPSTVVDDESIREFLRPFGGSECVKLIAEMFKSYGGELL